MRNQGEGTFASLEETKHIGEGAGIPIHVSHLKLADPRMWGKTEDVFRWFEQVNAAGLRATFDVYPYTRGCSGILRLLPPWAKEGGVADTIHRLTDPEIRKNVLHDCRNGIDGWENLAENIGWQNVFVTSFRKAENMGFEGLTVAQISDRLGRDPWEVYLDLVVEEEAKAGILVASMSTADMEKIVCHPESILASDGAAQSLRPDRNYGFQHPRAYGTQTKVLRRFVREKKLLTMEEAVKKMTSMPAELLGMKRRGKIKQGYYADVVVFDPETVSDMSTFSDLQCAPVGMEAVIVNGILALKEGEVICKTAGRLITKTDMA
jgi:N-acyl-D-amino-acid deacylase